MLVKVLDQKSNGVVLGIRANIERQALSSPDPSGFTEFFYSPSELRCGGVYSCKPLDRTRSGYFTRGEIQGGCLHVDNR